MVTETVGPPNRVFQKLSSELIDQFEMKNLERKNLISIISSKMIEVQRENKMLHNRLQQQSLSARVETKQNDSEQQEVDQLRQQIDLARDLIIEKEEQINQLKKELETVNIEKTNLSAELQRVVMKCTELEIEQESNHERENQHVEMQQQKTDIETKLKVSDEKIRSLKLGMMREKNLLLNQTEKFGDDLTALQKTVAQAHYELQQLKEITQQYEDYHFEAETMKKNYSIELERIEEELRNSREETNKFDQLVHFIKEKKLQLDEKGNESDASSVLMRDLNELISSLQSMKTNSHGRYRPYARGRAGSKIMLNEHDMESVDGMSHYSVNSSEESGSLPSSRSSSLTSSNGKPDLSVQPSRRRSLNRASSSGSITSIEDVLGDGVSISRRSTRRSRVLQHKPSIISLYRIGPTASDTSGGTNAEETPISSIISRKGLRTRSDAIRSNNENLDSMRTNQD